ncbi:MAG: hypothetical protein Q7S45_00430 [Candidatus Curtissbacteria bacterium]|nr:hypothetical protein [Candidatus Curtissbacteria bacterium]
MPLADQEGKRPHHLLVIFLILIFPPAAFYILWKYKGYHSWLAGLIWTAGLIILVYTLALNFLVLPYITRAISVAGVGALAGDNKWVWALLIFSIAQIIFGFYLRRVFKQQGDITRWMMIVCVCIFVLDYVFPGLIYGQITGQIYSSLGI